jgi:hypothetical protein
MKRLAEERIADADVAVRMIGSAREHEERPIVFDVVPDGVLITCAREPKAVHLATIHPRPSAFPRVVRIRALASHVVGGSGKVGIKAPVLSG